ncbi:inverse autotransporter beta domain-containing protein [Photorhabdus bodei]|nr:inverse autotransporter beta domain-containing protein [Photorhabdus bodei]
MSAITVALLLASCYKPNKRKESVVDETQKESLNAIGSEQKRKKRWLQHQTDDDVTQGGGIPKLAMADMGFAALQPEAEKVSAGEVRANLPLSDGKLTSGSIDFFYPLYDRDDRLFFGQVGVRRSDGRNIVNLGIGQRYFQGDWALGYNTFYDTQISGNAHQRLGFGLEYWRDYLYLSANGYFGLTDWYSSSALDGDAERVANGYDIRAQGWLAAYPQLSGKLKFEQYFGDDIALFNLQNHYKDPYALTVGLEYTPIQLISLGVDRTFSHRGKDDTKVNLSFNYQLGVPLSQQIDPTIAPVRRTLADNRYHLVERNNNIVLKHRERAQLSLHLPTGLSGFGGERKLINFSFNGKYRLKHIQWDDGALRARGGQIVALSNNSYAVQFPNYSSQQSNHLTISAVAHDEQGNVSNSSEMGVLINVPVTLSAPVIEPVEEDEAELVLLTEEGDEEPLFGDGREEELQRQQEEALRHQQQEELRRQQEEELRHQQEEELRHQQDEELRHQQDEELRHQQDEELRRQQEEELRRQQGEELRCQQGAEGPPPPPPPPPPPLPVAGDPLPGASGPPPARSQGGTEGLRMTELEEKLKSRKPDIGIDEELKIRKEEQPLDERGALMDAIRNGVKLRKVEKESDAETQQQPPIIQDNDVASILARRVAVEPSDTESEDEGSDSKDEDWADD